jgi:hypothetical protein
MTHYTIQIELDDHLQQTPIAPEDIEEILGLLGYSKPAIAAAAITVTSAQATVHWTDQAQQVAA